MDGAFAGALPHLRRSAPDQVASLYMENAITEPARPASAPDKGRPGGVGQRNRTLLLTLIATALAFFIAIIVKTWLFGK